MSRRVPGPPPGEVSTFVPEAYDNRSDANPIEIDIRTPVERERRSILLLTRAVDGDTAEAYAQDPAWMRAAFGLVSAVRNYVGASGAPIASGAELVEHGETDIVFEAMVAVLAVVSPTKTAEVRAEEKKDSAKSSSSPTTSPPSTPAIHPSNGTAVPAERAGSTSIADAP